MVFALIALWKGSGESTGQNEAEREVLPLAQLSHIWQEGLPYNSPHPTPPKTEPAVLEWRSQPIFSNPDIDHFYYKHVSQNHTIKQAEWAVICRILELLDRSGGCPSVVCNPDGNESGYGSDLEPDCINLLAHIPLWRHSLAVAEKILGSVVYGVTFGRYLIVALAHDIGKIPELYLRDYYTGIHPVIATHFLQGIPEFNRIYRNDELLHAVGNHHSCRVKQHSITAALKKADQQVRTTELAQQVQILSATKMIAEQEACLATCFRTETRTSEERNPGCSYFDVRKYSKPLLLDISGWFNAEKLITVIKENVNRVHNGWWNIVSTPDGYLFCSSKGLYRLLRRAFYLQPELLAAHANVIAQHDILFSVVMTLAREQNAIVSELLGSGEYLCRVSITPGVGKAYRECYMMVPFRAKAFGLSCTQLEMEKSQTIMRMVKSIVPLQRVPETKKPDQTDARIVAESAQNILPEEG
jgi:hypothetical protein